MEFYDLPMYYGLIVWKFFNRIFINGHSLRCRVSTKYKRVFPLLGIKGRECLLELIATFLVLQFLRTKLEQKGIVFKSLMKLDDASISRYSFNYSIKQFTYISDHFLIKICKKQHGIVRTKRIYSQEISCLCSYVTGRADTIFMPLGSVKNQGSECLSVAYTGTQIFGLVFFSLWHIDSVCFWKIHNVIVRPRSVPKNCRVWHKNIDGNTHTICLSV